MLQYVTPETLTNQRNLGDAYHADTPLPGASNYRTRINP